LIAECRSNSGLHAFVIVFPVLAEFDLMRREGRDAVQDGGTFRVYRAGGGLRRFERFLPSKFVFNLDRSGHKFFLTGMLNASVGAASSILDEAASSKGSRVVNKTSGKPMRCRWIRSDNPCGFAAFPVARRKREFRMAKIDLDNLSIEELATLRDNATEKLAEKVAARQAELEAELEKLAHYGKPAKKSQAMPTAKPKKDDAVKEPIAKVDSNKADSNKTALNQAA
jgi:hypothetical protein